MPNDKNIILVIDDGGLPTEHPDGSGYPLGLDCYQRILELAETLDIVVPIAVTAGFIDIRNRANLKYTNPNKDKLIQFLIDNRRRLPVWNHGLTHSFDQQPTEFLLLNPIRKVPEQTQRHHLELSQTIFEECGLGRPGVFVPPGHAWETGMTDKLAKQEGIQCIAMREVEKTPLNYWIRHPGTPYWQRWQASDHLATLYRLGLGIPYNKRHFNSFDQWKAVQYANPANTFIRYAIHRSMKPPIPPHHFFAHVHNFSNVNALEFWVPLTKKLLSTNLRQQPESPARDALE
jgi:hypothetical protein